ncbi:MAG: class I SAM-dependent RNA methyltransferase [Lachnospiraceae bacterium]|nr:class I SAM-dependent RNA methyltransferase [Lachnospiraceae bacterium]
MKQKELGEAYIERIDYPNRGRFIYREEDREYKGTIKNSIPGQKIAFRCCKKHGDRIEGTPLEILEHSPLETREPVCDIFPACGGCIYQTVPYEKQLEMKADMAKRLVEPVMYADRPIFDGIKGSPKEWGFRNKMEFSFGNEERDGELRLGLHKRLTRYTILDGDSCKTVHPDMTTILTCVREYCIEQNLPIYRKNTHEGFLRFLLIRRSEATGEILVCLAHSSQMTHDFRELKDRLLALSLAGHIVGIWTTEDNSFGDALLPETMHCLYGTDAFTEKLLGLTFEVTLFSFFQTNSKGAEVLYRTVGDYVAEAFKEQQGGKAITGHDAETCLEETEARPVCGGGAAVCRNRQGEKPVVYDLYCGTGTIGQLVSPYAKAVYGIEIIPEAVEAANRNARLNGISNCQFLAGDVLETLPALPEKPDFLILDPPREGIRPKTLRALMDFKVPYIVYVSCKASSFVQDMAVMRDYGWHTKRWALVDMFPQSAHVELVALLSRS